MCDVGTRLLQLTYDRVQYVRARALEFDFAASCRRGTKKCPDLDPIRHHPMRRPAQLLDPLDRYDVAARTPDAGAHRIQAFREVDDFRLASGILEHRDAVCEHRRHHQVLGTSHCDQVEDDARALETPGAGQDIALLYVDLRPQRLKPLDVQINRALTDGAAAGQRYPRLAKTRNHGPEHQNR